MPKLKLTPEEKLRLAEEKKRKAVLAKRQQKHDFISREVKLRQLSLKQHEKKWRQMLIDITVPEMKKELTLVWHNFERVIDTKDFTISLLMDYVRDAEEQYMMNLRCHGETIDNLITRFRDQLEELKGSNELEVESIKAIAEKEAEGIQKDAAETDEYFRTMLFGLEIAKTEQEKLVRGDYLSKIDEESHKYENIRQTLRVGLEVRHVGLWEKTKTFINQYIEQTASRKNAYIALTVQEEAVKKICAQQQNKLQNMQETIRKLRTRYNDLHRVQSVTINDLIEERQYFADAFAALKSRFDADRSLDTNNLAILTVKSNQAIGHLQAIANKGRRLLELSGICRKLETQLEKILPFPLPGGSSKATQEHSNIRIEEYKNVTNLYLFWQRVAQADAIRHTINEEREALKRENQILKSKIHHYCQCVKCPSLDDNQKSVKKPVGKVNVVDGYTIQKNYMKH